MATGVEVAAVAIIAITARSKDAAKMLLERNAGFLRDACRVGIDSLEKILDLLQNFPMDLDPDLRTRGCSCLAWLDLLVHF